ncbi:hypothetical protein ACFSTE_05925 [Aquimarina hainanensis]|uniref:Transposase n=1 Tax=Aquimarina hainanensis TaxID=1578017 RepID=A0ABW5N421_9FLAO
MNSICISLACIYYQEFEKNVFKHLGVCYQQFNQKRQEKAPFAFLLQEWIQEQYNNNTTTYTTADQIKNSEVLSLIGLTKKSQLTLINKDLITPHVVTPYQSV